jgi:hypothetical protein
MSNEVRRAQASCRHCTKIAKAQSKAIKKLTDELSGFIASGDEYHAEGVRLEIIAASSLARRLHKPYKDPPRSMSHPWRMQAQRKTRRCTCGNVAAYGEAQCHNCLGQVKTLSDFNLPMLGRQ